MNRIKLLLINLFLNSFLFLKQNSSFVKDILTISAVPMISQIIGFFLTPIVTRLYGPEAFGLLSTFSSIIGVIAIFSTLGYHNSLILPKHNDSAARMLLVCFVAVIAISTISVLIVVIGKDYFLQKMKIPELKYYLWLTPIFVLLHGLFQTLRFWNARHKNFRKIASSRVAEVACNKGSVLSLGFLGYTSGGSLIFGVLFASIIKNLILFGKTWKEISKLFKSRLNWSILFADAKRYRKFPLYSMWSELLSRIPALITVVLVLKYFNQTVLGYYSLSLMVLALPTTLLTSSIMEAFGPRAAMAKHEGKHVDLLKKVYERIVSLTFFPFMVLGIFGDILFNFVFGANWIEAGVIAQILVIRAFFEIIFTPVLSLINIMEKQEVSLISQFLKIASVIASLIIGGIYQNYYLAILLLSLLDSTVIAAAGIYMMIIIKFPFLQMIKKVFFYLSLCIIFGIILVVIRIGLDSSIIIILPIIVLITTLHYSAVLYLDKELRGIMFSFIKRKVPIRD